MKYLVTAREHLDSHKHGSRNFGMISIHGRDEDDLAKLFWIPPPMFLDLEFEDIEQVFIAVSGKSLCPISADQAASIVLFDAGCRSIGLKTILVQCEAGISRSAAVAAALARIGGDHQQADSFFDPDGDYSPNRYVYRMVLEAAGVQADRFCSDGRSLTR